MSEDLSNQQYPYQSLPYIPVELVRRPACMFCGFNTVKKPEKQAFLMAPNADTLINNCTVIMAESLEDAVSQYASLNSKWDSWILPIYVKGHGQFLKFCQVFRFSEGDGEA